MDLGCQREVEGEETLLLGQSLPTGRAVVTMVMLIVATTALVVDLEARKGCKIHG